MPRIDSLLHSYNQPGADANVPANTNKATGSSPSTTVKSSLSDNNNAQRAHDYVHGTPLSRMPDTSDDLERNWLTATATPRFSRAGLPHVVMPVRADSRKAKGRSSATSGTDNDPTSVSATVSRREVAPDSKTRGIYVAAEEGSSTSAVSPEAAMQNYRQNFTKRRHTIDDRRKSTIGSTDYLDDGNQSQTPFPDSSKSASGFTKLRRVLSLSGVQSTPEDPTSSFQQWRAHELVDDEGDRTRSELEAGDGGGRNDKKWQWSSIFKFLSGGTNKGLKLT